MAYLSSSCVRRVKILVHETRCANFSAPLNQDEFIIRDLILLLMSACRHGPARRGLGRGDSHGWKWNCQRSEPSGGSFLSCRVHTVIIDLASACVSPNGGLCDRD